MKRKLLVAALCFFVLLFLLAFGGPLFARLGGKPLFCISLNPIQIIPCHIEPTAESMLEAGALPHLLVDAQPTIIDTDMAPDDWMAIHYLLRRPDVDVKAITVAGTGETHCVPGVQNALNLAGLAGRPEVSVACGRETPLEGDHIFPTAWRDRADTLAGLSIATNPKPASQQKAFQLLASTIQSLPSKVVIITLGPLTNLAETLQYNPSLVDKVKMVYVMGGAFDVPGNIALSNAGIDNSVAEWNIFIDPHAAAVVLKSGIPVTFVSLDATNQTPITEDFYNRLGKERSTPAAEFVYRLLTRQFDMIRAGLSWFWDPLTAVISTDESLGTFAERSVTVVEEEGPESGAMRVTENGSSVRIAMTVDSQRFETLFLDVLNGQFYGTPDPIQ